MIDSRYRSRKPLIVTTNLTLEELQHPEDTAHARIYDRLLEMCVPICFYRRELPAAGSSAENGENASTDEAGKGITP